MTPLLVATGGMIPCRSPLKIATGGFIGACDQQPAVVERPTGAHRKHLWRNVREAYAESVSTRGFAYARYLRPEAEQRSIVDDPLFVSIRSSTMAAVATPGAGVRAAELKVSVQAQPSVHAPSTGAQSGFVSCGVSANIGVVSASGHAATPGVRVSGSAHYAYWTPETVQNPTIEMLYTL